MSKSIRGVEIFKAGKWNGDSYDEADLDSMVNAFPEVGFQVPIKLGHSNDIGGPAFGWVSRIWREGKVLFADIVDLAQGVYDQIRNGGFRHVSSEIFWNLERNGKKFHRVLKAVSLLGAETPAVSGLAPLRAMAGIGVPIRNTPIGRTLKRYVFDFPYGAKRTTTMNDNPGTEFIEYCQRLKDANPAMPDADILRMARNTTFGSKLLRAYGEQAVHYDMFTGRPEDNQ